MPDVAKVLASTANYMICDDHEFTDDLGEAGEDWKGPQRQQQHEHWAPFFSSSEYTHDSVDCCFGDVDVHS